MHIVIDARNINTSTGRYAERLIRYLEELDTVNRYTIVVPSKDLDFYKPVNMNFRMVASDYSWYSFGEQLGFRYFLYSLKPDLVHFTMPHHPIFFKQPYVTTIHDLILLNTYNSDKNYVVFHAKQLVGRFVFKAIGHGARRIIVPTQYVRRQYAAYAHISPDKVTVTYEGSGTSSSSSRPYEPLQEKQYIMYVGQQSDYKNIRRLMQTHQQLRRTYPELLLVLVGRLSGKNGVPLQRNKLWAETQNFAGIVFTDFLPDDQLNWAYTHCQAYIFPSLMEGFGLPALEAMSSGAAVVSSNASCLPEVYGDAAHYFDPLSASDMARAIDDILAEPILRQAYIAKGRVQAKKYSWRRMAEQTLAVYREVLK